MTARFVPTFMPIWQRPEGPPRSHWIRNLFLWLFVIPQLVGLVLTLTVALWLVWLGQIVWYRIRHRRVGTKLVRVPNPYQEQWIALPVCSCGVADSEGLKFHARPVLLYKRQLGAPGRKLMRWMEK